MKTNKIHYVLILAVILVFVLMSAAFAGAEEASDNWCFDPNHWGDGRCADENEWVRNWYYTCGWYRAAMSRGEYSLSQIPEMCRITLEPPAAVSTGTPEATVEPT
ncbi:MAG: hypothetical protein IT320_21405, partial [Anaerolineae bacterium]|nr:hypothetical protein [Anaerolineae bacterium]